MSGPRRASNAQLSIPARTPAVSAAARDIATSPDRQRAIDEAVSFALAHTTLLTLIDHLEAAGLDLVRTGTSRAIWQSSKTSTSIRPRLNDIEPGRVALADLRAALEYHKRRQAEVLAFLAAEMPHDCIVLYGQGLAMAHADYRCRFSHDIDLYAVSAAAGRKMVNLLVEHFGYGVTVDRTGSYRSVEVLDWKLDLDERDGNRFHIDICTGALANADSWMPPFGVDGLVDRARTADTRWGAALVPSDTDQMLLLAEKSLRNCSFSRREVSDALVLLGGSIDWDFVLARATRRGLAAPLDWMLTKATAAGVPGRLATPGPVSAPAAWERSAIRLLARDARVPARVQRAVRDAHRVAWHRRRLHSAGDE
jgi:hypothetical protein